VAWMLLLQGMERKHTERRPKKGTPSFQVFRNWKEQ